MPIKPPAEPGINEIKAMGVLERTMEALAPDARPRVLAWLLAKYGAGTGLPWPLAPEEGPGLFPEGSGR
jgi:hypothetical protein